MRAERIAIVGGGLGGLTAALALTQAGYVVRLYERAPQVTPIGAGISLWPNGVKVLRWLGVGDSLDRLAPTIAQLRYLAPDGEVLCETSLEPLAQAAGQRPFPVARTDIQMLLLGHVGAERVTLDACCTAVQQDDEHVRLFFEGGAEVEADLVIAADGVRSTIREHVVGQPWPARYAGDVNWNGLLDAREDLGPRGAFTIVVGEHKRCGLMPVSGDRVYFFFDAPLPAEPVVERGGWREELRSLFAGWAAPAAVLIDALDEANMVRQPLHDVAPLEDFVRGRVALLGDAAHGATPMLGQGASQAMEDAAILTRCLVTTDLGVEAALVRYQEQRRERAHLIARASRARTELLMGVDPRATAAWYQELRTAPGRSLVAAMTQISVSGPFA